MDYNGYEYDYSCSGDEYVLALEMSKTLITLDSIHMDYNGYEYDYSCSGDEYDSYSLDMSNYDMSMTLYSGYE